MKPATHADIIALWPTAADLARAIGEKPDTVRRWRLRSSIPAWHWQAIDEAARTSGIRNVTVKRLYETAPKRAEAEKGKAA